MHAHVRAVVTLWGKSDCFFYLGSLALHLLSLLLFHGAKQMQLRVCRSVYRKEGGGERGLVTYSVVVRTRQVY